MEPACRLLVLRCYAPDITRKELANVQPSQEAAVLTYQQRNVLRSRCGEASRTSLKPGSGEESTLEQAVLWPPPLTRCGRSASGPLDLASRIPLRVAERRPGSERRRWRPAPQHHHPQRSPRQSFAKDAVRFPRPGLANRFPELEKNLIKSRFPKPSQHSDAESTIRMRALPPHAGNSPIIFSKRHRSLLSPVLSSRFEPVPTCSASKCRMSSNRAHSL